MNIYIDSQNNEIHNKVSSTYKYGLFFGLVNLMEVYNFLCESNLWFGKNIPETQCFIWFNFFFSGLVNNFIFLPIKI